MHTIKHHNVRMQVSAHARSLSFLDEGSCSPFMWHTNVRLQHTVMLLQHTFMLLRRNSNDRRHMRPIKCKLSEGSKLRPNFLLLQHPAMLLQHAAALLLRAL